MPKAHHTPGPWFLSVNDPQGAISANICTVFSLETQSTEDGKGQSWLHIGAHKACYDVSPAESSANACLIAAAPELLAYAECEEAAWDGMLNGTWHWKEVFARHGFDVDTHKVPRFFLESMRAAAIAKARGEA